MANHRDFSVLRNRLSPESRQRAKAETLRLHREYALSQIRKELGVSRQTMADRLDVSQPTYANCEKSRDMRIGTLQRIVAAFGGSLSLNIEIDGAVFPFQLSVSQ